MCADRTGDLKVPDWPGRRADDPGHDRIAAMLVLDIGNAPQWAGRVAREIEDVVTGTSSGWEMVMNAHILTVGKDKSGISSADDAMGDDPVEIATADLMAALAAWIERIEQGAS